MPTHLTRRISLTIVVMAASVGVLNFCAYFFLQSIGLVNSLVQTSVWSLFVFAFAFSFSRFLPERAVQILQILLILFLSGPMTLAGPFSYFGMWFFVLSLILLYKYGFLTHWATPKVLIASLYFSPFLVLSVFTTEGTAMPVLRIVNYFIFLLSCLAFLYFIFEEEIRDLLAANRKKDTVLAEKNTELADQARTIARLEPLSIVGERVAHVAHSFKNNLSTIGTVVFYLDQLHDEKRAVAKLEEFIKTVNERVDNILMMSRAGIDLEPEVFDVARLLRGLKEVYLSDRSFTDHATTELTTDGPWEIRAVRWDFLLMVENILKNALEAIIARGQHGTIRIDLSEGRLILANDGGAMERCLDCNDSCLDCVKYGQPGRTKKRGGSGFGLAQVFGTCRKNGWDLKIRTSGQWTRFEIMLAKGNQTGRRAQSRAEDNRGHGAG